MLRSLHLLVYFMVGFSTLMVLAYIYDNALAQQAVICQEGC